MRSEKKRNLSKYYLSAFSRQTVKEMMSFKLANELRQHITDSETHDPSYYGTPRYHVPIKTGTTHLAVLAANGDAVSLTSTVNG